MKPIANHRRVLCPFMWWAPMSHEIIRGIREYTLSKSSWILTFPLEDSTGPDMLDDTKFDGVITTGAYEADWIAWLARCRKPIVSVGDLPAGPNRCRVERDDLTIGKVAAEHFLDRGFTHFAYIGQQQKYSVRRLEGFTARLSQVGKQCQSWVRPDGTNWTQSPEAIAWLASLPRPTALFCCNDYYGREALALCRLYGLRVPEEIAVLGVDNSLAWVETAVPPLSSIIVPWQKVGFVAAHQLDRLMDGEPAPSEESVIVSHEGVAVRQSSDINAVSDPEIAEALAYLNHNACKGISVSDVLRVCPIARRRLEQACRTYLGRTPHEAIRRAQMERACELIAHTQIPLKDIPAKVGLTRTRFFQEFRGYSGCTPQKYRAKHSRPMQMSLPYSPTRPSHDVG